MRLMRRTVIGVAAMAAALVGPVAGAAPAPSPASSGKLLYYHAVPAPRGTYSLQLHEIDPDGAGDVILDRHATGNCVVSIARDNAEVATVSNWGLNRGPSRFRETYADGKLIHSVTLPEGRHGYYESCNPSDTTFALSPNGKLLAVAASALPSGQALLVLDTATSKVVATPVPYNQIDEPFLSAMAWGPGNRELTVGISHNGGNTWSIEIVRFDGQVVKHFRTRIESTAGVELMAVTNRDALFEAQETAGPEDGIYEQPLAGGPAKTVYLEASGAPDPLMSNVAWSPEGHRMAITDNNVTRIEFADRTGVHRVGHGVAGAVAYWVSRVAT